MALPDPLESGSVVRIESHLSKYPEVWVLSHINGGRWYPDTDSWMTSHARGPLEDGGAHWEDLLARGRVTLLVAVDRESYEAGWRAACTAIRDQAEELTWDTPEEAPDAARQ